MEKPELDAGLSEALRGYASDYVRYAGGAWSAWNVRSVHNWLHDDQRSVLAQADASGRNPLDHLSVAVSSDLEALAVMQSWKVWECAETSWTHSTR